ncbi:MAG TPA: hypothetical protein VJB90_03205 [Candidatus Nanoarchaeia archaeon]|nr:hypothetical protein [Candidatus Nanoarchaeia archaeon]
MHRKLTLDHPDIYGKIREMSNITKFRIIELTQEKEMSITLLAKKADLAYNKCVNYCTELSMQKLLIKKKNGKNVFVKSKVDLHKLAKLL